MSLSDLQDITEIVWHPLRMRLTTHFPQAAFLYLLLLFLWLAWCVGREYGRTRTLTSFLFVSYSFLLFALLFLCRIVSCLFECLQAYFSVGAFQISDIVYNALSGGIGAGLYSIIHKHWTNIRKSLHDTLNSWTAVSKQLCDAVIAHSL